MSRYTHRAVALSAAGICYLILGVSVARAGNTPPTISKAFNPTSISSGGASTITFTLTNSVAIPLTSGSFSDTLANMAISGAQAAGGTCVGAGSNIFANNATALAFSGITIPASGNCTVTVVVTSSTVGANPNTTSRLLRNYFAVAVS